MPTITAMSLPLGSDAYAKEFSGHASRRVSSSPSETIGRTSWKS
jgi:hypothetical protein